MLARASELDRLLACPGSAFLDRNSTKSTYAQEAALWGSTVHLWKETGVYPEERRFRDALKRRVETAKVDRLRLWPAGGEHEIALAFNVVSGVVRRCTVPAGEDRDTYQARWKAAFDDEWITGTADFCQDVFGEPWVDDLKTGRLAHWKDYEAQQSFYCLAYGKLLWGEVVRSRSTLTHWPRYPLANPPSRFGSVLEVDFLKHFWQKLGTLRDTILRLRGSSAHPMAPGSHVVLSELSMGNQCEFCPSRGACPKFGASQDSRVAAGSNRE